MKIFNELFKVDDSKNIGLSGMTDESFSVYISSLFNKENKSILIVTPTLYEASNLLNSLINFQNHVLFFPMDDFLTSMAISISPDLEMTRLETLSTLISGGNYIVVTHLMGYLRFLPTIETYIKNVLNIKLDDEYEITKIATFLISMGYKKETIVTKTGEFALRGFVIDIFPLSENHPVRLEFFGDTIESIRYFDEDSQISIKQLDSITIYPVTELLFADSSNIDYVNRKKEFYKTEITNINDYLKSFYLVIKDYNQIKNQYLQIESQILEYKEEKDPNYQGKYMHKLDILDYKNAIHYLRLDSSILDYSLRINDYNVKEIDHFHENIDLINAYFKKNSDKTIVVCLKTYQIKNFIKYLEVPYILTDENDVRENYINIISKEINNGFMFSNFIILSDKDLFNIKERSKKYKTKFKYASKIKDVNKLELGDYVVHITHGIGIYNGIKTLSMIGLTKDYIELLYKNNDKLYIPVEKIELINKYASKDDMVPHINSLSNSEWEKSKNRIKDRVHDIAKELIKLYALREMKEGFSFGADDELQLMFENEVNFEPTADQLLATSQIKSDMENKIPMDRLLCGDVGFGKTEVAFRAMFKAVNSSKQVLYLCPTTILSIQQYNSAKDRFKNYPVNIELLNRFVTPKETTRIINGLKDGSVDILIGTHRLLSDDIKPYDLGLLVVDEEQRFGVTHKERLKKYKTNVDVLTLTATPIPRTLQMSLIGIRSLSLISTPPVNRYPIQTYVVEESKQLIKEAIYKELSRDGQVFILYNRVETIEKKMAEIQEIVPLARIVIAHGQMNKIELENTMLRFINHEFDVLICTTIIETGIDIPNVNTLIILDADHFGLSQLYQIRGRVGRSDKIAYAYMMYHKGKILNGVAAKRLEVIKEFTELGSGYSIASRDLAIRGAGDILGSEQAGFIDSVGIDLYLRILEDEIKKLRGEVTIEEKVNEEKNLLNVTTHIDNTYVSENDLKIEIHKLINTIDSYDQLKRIKTIIEDRFGRINEDILVYMYQEWFETMARKLNIIKVSQTKKYIELVFDRNMTEKINVEKLFMDAYQISRYFKFNSKNNYLIVTLELLKLEKHYLYYLVDLLKTLI